MTTKVISGSYPNGYYLDPFFDSLDITSTATVAGPGVTTAATQPSTITNAGQVSDSQNGISFAGGGSLSNAGSGASIQGVTAVAGSGGFLSIDNQANIASTAVPSVKQVNPNFVAHPLHDERAERCSG